MYLGPRPLNYFLGEGGDVLLLDIPGVLISRWVDWTDDRSENTEKKRLRVSTVLDLFDICIYV